MVNKCLMTLGQQFSIFWQQAGHLEICYYYHFQPGKINFEDWISFTCYVIWVMDDVKCATFVSLIMAVAAEVVNEKSGICIWQKAWSSKKWAVATELRNFLINGFYMQGSKSIWISNNLLGSSYFLSGNQDRY